MEEDVGTLWVVENQLKLTRQGDDVGKDGAFDTPAKAQREQSVTALRSIGPRVRRIGRRFERIDPDELITEDPQFRAGLERRFVAIDVPGVSSAFASSGSLTTGAFQRMSVMLIA